MSAEAPALLLRADAGPGIGSGHVSRLLSLAEAWISAGGRAKLFSSGLSKAMENRATDLSIAVLDPKKILDSVAPGCWVAVDGYSFDAAYFRELRGRGARVLAVDDVPRLPDYPVDILLNQNAGAESRSYSIPPQALPLLGPRWALLRRAISETSKSDSPRRDGTRILVSFGGADPENASALAIRALRRLKRPYRALVVAGPDNPRAAELESLSAGAPIVVKRSVDMAAAMADADAGVLSGGVTMLEACVAGLPALVATVADNQEPGAAALARAGAVRLLGRAPELTEIALADSIDELLADLDARAELSRAARLAVDGRGAARAVAVMLSLSEEKLDSDRVTLRPAKTDDALEIWRIANEYFVRASSFRKGPIPLEDHLNWFEKRLASPDERFWVLDCAGAVAGSVRYVKSGDAAEVHYSVRGAFRGKGLGTLALSATKSIACRELKTGRLFGAVILPNPASERSFASAGWERKSDRVIDGKTCAMFEAGC